VEERYKALALRYFGRKSEKGKEGDSKQYRLFDEAEVYAREEGEKETVKAAGNGGIGKEAIEIIGGCRGKKGSGHIANTFVMKRKDRAGPDIKGLQEWQDSHKAAVPPESSLEGHSLFIKSTPLAERYVEHYLLTPDTNGVENAIRPFVAGKKGWLFCGSARGVYSLIETAKANGGLYPVW
jgi:hypothetical protein